MAFLFLVLPRRRGDAWSALDVHPLLKPVYTCLHESPETTILTGLQWRPSKLNERLANEKVERARHMTPEERVTVALHLSDFCHELSRAARVH